MTTHTLTKSEARAVRYFAAAKRAEAKAIARKKRWEKEVFAALGDATEGVSFEDNVLVKIQTSSNSSFDREVLKNRFPEAYAATFRTSTYSFLKVL